MAPSAAKVKRFSDALRQRLQGSDVVLRKAYLRTLVDRVVVGEKEIRMIGRKDVLASGVLRGEIKPVPGVHGFVPKWRADSQR